MKEIKKERTITETYTKYEAIDGTLFTNKEECQEYENTARCVLRAKVKRLIVTKEHNAWNLMGGADDNNIIGIKFKNEEDVQSFLQYYCLDNTYYMKDEYKDKLQKISDKCFDVLKNNDILLVGIDHNCEDAYYIINSRNNIIENLKNIDKDEPEKV